MMQIYDMKVNHLSNPLGFRLECTVFSWKVKEAKGKRQEAARIQIALDEQMENLLLDTGFEQDADSLGWKLDLKLKPCTRYYWTVTIRSDVKEEQISEVQWFETGRKRFRGRRGGLLVIKKNRGILFLKRRLSQINKSRVQDYIYAVWGFMKCFIRMQRREKKCRESEKST